MQLVRAQMHTRALSCLRCAFEAGDWKSAAGDWGEKGGQHYILTMLFHILQGCPESMKASGLLTHFLFVIIIKR